VHNDKSHDDLKCEDRVPEHEGSNPVLHECQYP
jgi:hypothetical protein